MLSQTRKLKQQFEIERQNRSKSTKTINLSMFSVKVVEDALQLVRLGQKVGCNIMASFSNRTQPLSSAQRQMARSKKALDCVLAVGKDEHTIVKAVDVERILKE